jgi:hypothetical protein
MPAQVDSITCDSITLRIAGLQGISRTEVELTDDSGTATDAAAPSALDHHFVY